MRSPRPAPTGAPTTPAPATTSSVGCPTPSAGQPSGVPDGADSAPTVDVDGDGRRDTAWINDETDVGGGVPFGVATASGGIFFENTCGDLTMAADGVSTQG